MRLNAVTRLGKHSEFIAGVMAVVLMCAAPASAQCTSSKACQDDSVPGNPRFHSVTTQMQCSGRETYVAGWISGNVPGYGCSTGGCVDTSTDGNASTTVWGTAHGNWSATSAHQYYQEGQTTDLGTCSKTLNAGRAPEEECEDGGNLWDPDAEICEINPDGPGSPIVIAIGKNAKYKMTSATNGVIFDLNADGVPEQIAWTEADSEVAFLALDRDGDGKITSGQELFGDHTLPGVPNGFHALQLMTLETNGGVERGSVSSEDPIFDRLLLWIDRNHNGISERAELRRASTVVTDIGLGYKSMPRRDGFGNQFRFRGWVHIRTAPGRNQVASKDENDARTRTIWDVFFVVRQ